ncbi:hypothetical protein K438DRAFT_2059017 [Mycena galopus ATCC 62051]|nr:hypothetical protein K438DRAFT_2059017 [Mycena galopus ATCC 62051]
MNYYATRRNSVASRGARGVGSRGRGQRSGVMCLRGIRYGGWEGEGGVSKGKREGEGGAGGGVEDTSKVKVQVNGGGKSQRTRKSREETRRAAERSGPRQRRGHRITRWLPRPPGATPHDETKLTRPVVLVRTPKSKEIASAQKVEEDKIASRLAKTRSRRASLRSSLHSVARANETKLGRLFAGTRLTNLRLPERRYGGETRRCVVAQWKQKKSKATRDVGIQVRADSARGLSTRIVPTANKTTQPTRSPAISSRVERSRACSSGKG